MERIKAWGNKSAHLFEPRLSRSCVRVKSLFTGKCRYVAVCLTECFLLVIRKRALLYKIVNRQGTWESRGSACRERVIGTRVIIAACLGAISSEEYRACVSYFVKILKRLVYAYLKMLGRDKVCDLKAELIDLWHTAFSFWWFWSVSQFPRK